MEQIDFHGSAVPGVPWERIRHSQTPLTGGREHAGAWTAPCAPHRAIEVCAPAALHGRSFSRRSQGGQSLLGPVLLSTMR